MTFHIPKKALLLGSAKLKPQEVFKTSLYTGTASAQTITTGLDMAGKGGLVWLKTRSLAGSDHELFDTARGARKLLSSSMTAAESDTSTFALQSFTSSGFTLGNGTWFSENASGATQVAWSWLERAKFFCKVTYTGNGVAGRQIPHSLGVVPGMVIIKQRSAASEWYVYHRSLGDFVLRLNSTNAREALDPGGGQPWTSATFGGLDALGFNANGGTYVAYLFAQNPDLIDCGSYVGNGSTTGPVVTCGSGWRPQWLLVKNASVGTNWIIVDTARGLGAGADLALFPNTSGAEFSDDFFATSSTGFQPVSTSAAVNTSGNTYVFAAIREPY